MFNAYGVDTDCPEAIKVGVCGADQSCHGSGLVEEDELQVEASELLAVKADRLDLEKGDDPFF